MDPFKTPFSTAISRQWGPRPITKEASPATPLALSKRTTPLVRTDSVNIPDPAHGSFSVTCPDQPHNQQPAAAEPHREFRRRLQVQLTLLASKCLGCFGALKAFRNKAKSSIAPSGGPYLRRRQSSARTLKADSPRTASHAHTYRYSIEPPQAFACRPMMNDHKSRRRTEVVTALE
jgi:hypothetical protein